VADVQKVNCGASTMEAQKILIEQALVSANLPDDPPPQTQ
jgi:hypothetical protein